MAVRAPSGPYKIQRTPPECLLIRLPSPPAPEIVPWGTGDLCPEPPWRGRGQGASAPHPRGPLHLARRRSGPRARCDRGNRAPLDVG